MFKQYALQSIKIGTGLPIDTEQFGCLASDLLVVVVDELVKPAFKIELSLEFIGDFIMLVGSVDLVIGGNQPFKAFYCSQDEQGTGRVSLLQTGYKQTEGFGFGLEDIVKLVPDSNAKDCVEYCQGLHAESLVQQKAYLILGFMKPLVSEVEDWVPNKKLELLVRVLDDIVEKADELFLFPFNVVIHGEALNQLIKQSHPDKLRNKLPINFGFAEDADNLQAQYPNIPVLMCQQFDKSVLNRGAVEDIGQFVGLIVDEEEYRVQNIFQDRGAVHLDEFVQCRQEWAHLNQQTLYHIVLQLLLSLLIIRLDQIRHKPKQQFQRFIVLYFVQQILNNEASPRRNHPIPCSHRVSSNVAQEIDVVLALFDAHGGCLVENPKKVWEEVVGKKAAHQPRCLCLRNDIAHQNSSTMTPRDSVIFFCEEL